MRVLAQILCVMLSLSSVLLPLNRLHAHVSDQEHRHQVNVHGGHSHDGGAGHTHEHDGSVHSHEATGTVVDLKPDLSQGSSQAWKPLHWIAVLFAVAVIIFELRPICLTPRPPRTRTRPPSPYPFALPLLRGPPISI